MRSRIHKLKSYTDVDFSAYKQPFRLDEAAIEKEFQRIRNKKLRWADGTVAGKGDAAVCRLESKNPRFNKASMQIAVGAGMLPKPIEQAVLGLQVGSTVTVTVNDQAVHITLLSVKNKLLPELSDTLIAEAGMEGVQTVAQLRAKLEKEQREKAADAISYDARVHVLDTVLQDTEFILDKEDWKNMVSLSMARNAVLCQQDGMDIHTMTEQDFNGRIPARNYEGVVALVQDNAWETLCNHLLGKYYAEQDGYAPTQESYESYIAEYVQFWRVSDENARQSNPYNYYEAMEYVSYFVGKVSKFVKENIFTEE